MLGEVIGEADLAASERRRCGMRRFGIAGVVAGLVVAGLVGPGPGTGVAAASPAGGVAVCTWTHDLRVAPGLSLTPTSGQWLVAEYESVITCVGAVSGQPVTGPGIIRAQGTVSGTCAQGNGAGHQTVILPTAGGTVQIENPITVQFTGPIGTFGGPRISGIYQFAPTSGNCLTAPLTGALILAQGVIRG